MAMRTPTFESARDQLADWAESTGAASASSIAHLRGLTRDGDSGIKQFGKPVSTAYYVLCSLARAREMGATFPAALWEKQAGDMAQTTFLRQSPPVNHGVVLCNQ